MCDCVCLSVTLYKSENDKIGFAPLPQTPKKIELVTWDCHSITTQILLRNELKIALIKDVRNYILMAEW